MDTQTTTLSSVHPHALREALPAELLLEIDAFASSLHEPGAEDDCAGGWAEAVEELDDSSLELLDPEEPSLAHQDSRLGGWPRPFEEHLAEVQAAGQDPVARRALSLMGLGDITGFEPVVAAISVTSEALMFWQPMAGMHREGFFTAHLRDLRGCLALLEAHPAPAEGHAPLRLRWEAARDEVLELIA